MQAGNSRARQTFDSVAETYERARPRYPQSMFDDLFALLPKNPRLLEVGPGTGQATRDLLARGAIVDAVELGPAMAENLRRSLPSEALRVTVGDFEDVPTGPPQYDCVFAATAYHWIAPEAQLARPAALLKPRGLLAIVDLIQVSSPADAGFFDAAQPIYQRYGQGHTGPPAPLRHQADPPMRAALADDHRFINPTVLRYDWDQTYTATQYRDLMSSYSTTLLIEPHTRTRLLDDMETFVKERFDNRVVRPLVVTLTTATLIP